LELLTDKSMLTVVGSVLLLTVTVKVFRPAAWISVAILDWMSDVDVVFMVLATLAAVTVLPAVTVIT